MVKITIFRSEEFDGGNSRALLFASVSAYSGISEADFILSHERGKKPYFLSHPDIHFSLSHSGKLLSCAFSSVPVGHDVQYPRGNISTERIAGRYFCENERKLLGNGFDFFELWCRKEAMVKLSGEGIGSWRSFSLCDSSEDIFLSETGKVRIKTTDKTGVSGFSSAVACYDDFELTFKYI